MREVPRHWQPASEQVEHEGRRFPLRVWGWSLDSPADAATRARYRLSAAVEQLTRGGSGFDYYPRSPLREEVLHEVRDDSGGLVAAVTRNRMGAQVLNTDTLLIADVDLPRPRRRGLFRRREEDPGTAARQRIDAWAAAHPDRGVRTYRTAAGLRVLVTGAPAGTPDLETLVALGSDDLYVRLCGQHETYRARLTPKPHRVGMPRIPVAWPWDAEQEQSARSWLEHYATSGRDTAVCELLTATGPPPTGRQAELVELHDRATAATSGRALA